MTNLIIILIIATAIASFAGCAMVLHDAITDIKNKIKEKRNNK